MRPHLARRGRAIMCDDLAGACEVAGVLTDAGYAAVVALSASIPAERDLGDVTTVIDLDLRHSDEAAAHAAVTAVAVAWDVSYLKIDSLLRGPIRGMVSGMRATRRRRIVSTALPIAGRTVMGGVPHIDGRPVAETDAWRLEPTSPPRSVADVLDADDRDDVIVADAVDDADLDVIAAIVAERDLFPIGSAGLLQAMVRRETAPPLPSAATQSTPNTHRSDPDPNGAVLVVVGTASEAARSQVDELARRGATVVELDDHPNPAPFASSTQQLGDALDAGGTVVVRWRRSSAEPSRSGHMAERLAEMIGTLVEDRPDLPIVLTGGHTARTVLDRLNVARLDIDHVAHHGAVVTRADTGRRIAIRPGSFGDDQSLAILTSQLTMSLPQENPPCDP